MAVGAPGGPRRKKGYGMDRGKNRAKAEAYRQSDKGRLARQMQMMNPETRMHRKMMRDAHRKMKAGF